MTSGSLFRVLKTDGAARLGRLSLQGHAAVETPNMLLYTFKGSALCLTPDLVAKLPASGIALDAMHFLKHPLPEPGQQHAGGARGFLAPSDLPLIATGRDAIAFEYDGSTNRDSETSVRTAWGNMTVSPQSYMSVIAALAPELWTALADEVASTVSRKRARAAVTRTVLWLDACIAACPALGVAAPLLAPITGGCHHEERARSAREAAARDCVAGFALTGFGTGESHEQLEEAIAAAVAELPAGRPRLAQGIGAPDAMLAAVECGVDLFDSGYAHVATAAGTALTFTIGAAGPSAAKASHGNGSATSARQNEAAGGLSAGGAVSDAAASRDSEKGSVALDLRDTRHRLSKAPLLAGCTCYTCSRHSRAYVHHLLQTEELLAMVLLDAHNCHHTLRFFSEMRAAIAAGRFAAFRDAVLAGLEAGGLPAQAQEPSGPGMLRASQTPVTAALQ